MDAECLERMHNNSRRKDPFHQAIIERDLAKVKFCLKYGGSSIRINARNNFGRTPLQESCFTGDLDLVLLLLDQGCDIDLKDERGRTALHFAAISGFCHLARVLLDACADVVSMDDEGHLPIDLARDEQMTVVLACAMYRHGYEETARWYLEKAYLIPPRDYDETNSFMEKYRIKTRLAKRQTIIDKYQRLYRLRSLGELPSIY